jgi:hypothetical protein
MGTEAQDYHHIFLLLFLFFINEFVFFESKHSTEAFNYFIFAFHEATYLFHGHLFVFLDFLY